ncbi:hypothetical protein N2W15_001720 [Clostridium perfringens]|nr:hypothetical protein [Clostridium perfringens]
MKTIGFTFVLKGL